MGELTIVFLVVVGALLLVALAVDLYDRRNGRDPKRRADLVKNRTEHRRTVKTALRSNRMGVGDSLEAQFQAPPDDHEIRPDRRRRN